MAQTGILSAPYRMTDLSTPGSIFGTNNPYSTPPIAGEPFQYGAGGARLTQDQLKLRQQQATALQQTDFSPVQSVWQGLGRVAGNALGAFQQKGLDKEAAAQAADEDKSIAALLAGGAGQNSAVAAALTGGSKTAQALAMEIYKRQNPAPVNNDTVQDYNFRAQTLGKDAADAWLKSSGDQFITATLPGGSFYAGPQSGFATAMGGGSAPQQQGPQPGAVMDGYRFKGGDPANQANWEAAR